MAKPLVTVVTITYNLVESDRKRYFRQCVKSVHDQTYTNIEHIIVDGASKDGTIALIKEYATKGWLRYISEPDSGVYDAMNKGIAAAKGKYITFLNSDDFYSNPKAVELSVEALEEAAADYSYANTQGIDASNGQKIDIWRGNVDLIPFGNHYCHQSMFVKTRVLKDLGGFDLHYRVSADSDMMVRLVALGKKPIYVPECIVSYRSGGLSNQHILQTRKDHSSTFYTHLGEEAGLTRGDCYLMWNFSLFNEKNILYCLFFGLKIKNPGWRKQYYKRFFGPDNFRIQIKKALPWPVRRPIAALYKIIKTKG